MAPPTFTPNQILDEDHINEWLRGPLWVRKSADQQRNNTTTLALDSELFMSVDANKVYLAEVRVLYAGPPSIDIQLQLAIPSGASFRGYAHQLTTDATHTGRRRFHPIVDGWNGAHGITEVGLDNNAIMRGALIMGGTSGTFGLNWCQLASSASHCIVRANSYITLRRVE